MLPVCPNMSPPSSYPASPPQPPYGYLLRLEPRRDPGVLLGGAARVIVGDGVSLEVRHQPGHHLLQLARHGMHGVLLAHALAVYADLPEEQRAASEPPQQRPVEPPDISIRLQAHLLPPQGGRGLHTHALCQTCVDATLLIVHDCMF